jgi:hypothetical protein
MIGGIFWEVRNLRRPNFDKRINKAMGDLACARLQAGHPDALNLELTP